jgi:hypothetical protein
MSSFITSITGRKKTPEKLVRLSLRCLGEIVTHVSRHADTATTVADQKQLEENQDELCKRLSQMKAILYGSGDKLEIDEDRAKELALSIQSVIRDIYFVNSVRIVIFCLGRTHATINSQFGFNSFRSKQFFNQRPFDSHFALRLVRTHLKYSTI